MHISKLSVLNYRNFSNAKLVFSPGVNTVIGENGAGKTNLFRAIRLLLDENMIASAYRLNEGDFHRALGSWKGHWIVVSAEFAEVTPDESIQALFVHGTGVLAGAPVDRATYNLLFRPTRDIRLKFAALEDGDSAGLQAIQSSITLDDYETVFMGRSTADFNDPDFYRRVVGDFEGVVFGDELDFDELGVLLPKQLAVAREISFSYIKALRDVVQDFQNNRANPLRTLLRSKSGEVDPVAFKLITDKVLDLNRSIEEWPDVAAISGDIAATIKEAVGEAYSPSSMSIKSDLPDDADRLFQALKLFVGEDEGDYEGSIEELSLGGANLIYLTLKLLEFKYNKAKRSLANFLLIEEPEAHIHTHIQKTLFDRLNYEDTQIIYSTHSTQISEVSNIESMNILARDDGRCEAYQPAVGLDATAVRNVQRYLDAVRSNLLFAKSVILVEGDAEEILVPALVKQVLGVGLDELGVSLINIRSTGFENVAALFHQDRIRKRCCILTDLDAAMFATDPNEDDTPAVAEYRRRAKASEVAGALRSTRLQALVEDNAWLAVEFSPHTFEVDFVAAGNSSYANSLVREVYSQSSTIEKAIEQLGSDEVRSYGVRILRMAEHVGKGWFAVMLAGHVDAQVTIPAHIINALRFVSAGLTDEVWFNIFLYRIELLAGTGEYDSADIESYRTALQAFRAGETGLQSIVGLTAELFPTDGINQFVTQFLE